MIFYVKLASASYCVVRIMISHKFILYNNSSLHYAKTGNGEKHLLIFHGFGQDIRVFDYFTRSLARHYSFYVFDLYFHGKSKWGHGEKTLTKKEWKETIGLFLIENKIDRFQVAGFSLGGKFVLATVEAFYKRIEKVYLIAPDGIKTNFWYNLATYPTALRKLFKSMIFRPRRFLALVKFLNKTGSVDDGLIRFAEYQMNTEEKRSRVYYSWVVFRHLTFDVRRISRLINEQRISVMLIVGKYDKVIKPGDMERLTKRLNHYKMEVLESGHSELINQSLPFFITEE